MPPTKEQHVNKNCRRTRVGAGTSLHVEPVTPNIWRKRWAEVHDALTAQFKAKFQTEPDEAQRQLVRRTATTAVMAERYEIRCASGEEISDVKYGALSIRLVRLLAALGLTKHTEGAEDPTDDVENYLAKTYGKRPRGGHD